MVRLLNSTFLWLLLPAIAGCNGVLGKIKMGDITVGTNLVQTYAPTFTVPNVTEGNTLSFTFTLSAPLDVARDFDYTVFGAGAASDFTSLTGTVSLIAGATGGTINIPTTDNAVYDLFRDYGVTLTARASGAESRSESFRVLDNESVPVVSFTAVSQNVNENAVLPTAAISVTPSSKFPISVSYLVGGSASAGGVDHSLIAGTISVPALTSSVSLSLPIVNDAISEATETVILTLDSITSGAATLTGTNVKTISIIDDEAVNLVIDDVSVGEGGVAMFTVSLSMVSAVDVTFDWTTANGTGNSVSDYIAGSGTGVTILAGNLSTTLTVTARNDATVCEANKTFLVNLSNVTIAAVADGTGTGTLTDNDIPTVAFSSATSSGAEGTATNTTHNIVASLSAVCGTSAVSFQAASSNGTAISGTDYTLLPLTTFNIPAGSPSVNVPLTSLADPSFEGDETVTLTMSNQSGATLDGQTTHVLTLSNDDAKPTLSIGDLTFTEGNGGGTQNATMTVNLSVASGFVTTVDYSTSNGTATNPGDYTSTSGTLSIPAGSSSGTFTIPVVRDTIDEVDETINVTLSGGNGNYDGTGGDLAAILTITDDDASPTISLGVPATVAEGANITFVVSLSQASEKNITFDFATADGTGTQPGDYASVSSSHTILAGATSANIAVGTIDDAVHCEGTETVSGTLSNIANATAGTLVRSGSITDNDVPTVAFSSASSSGAEGNGANGTHNITATLSALCVASAVTFQAVTSNGTASSATDYTAIPLTTFTIPAGSPSVNVSVTSVADVFFENDETLTLTMSNPASATLGAQTTHVLTLTNDDSRPTLSVADITVTEGTGAGTVNATFTVTMSAASGLTTTVDYATSNGTASQPGDYTSTSGTLTILAGATTGTISIPVVRDTTDEFDETVNFTLSGGNGNYDGAGGDLLGVLTITDDDAPPTITLTSNVSSGTEGANAGFTAQLSAASGKTITFDFNTSDGTATAGADYTGLSQGYTINPGSTSQSITVSTTNDAINCESTETFTGTISNIVNASAGTVSVVASINENDNPVLTLNSETVTEGSSATITLTSSLACPTQAITATWATFNNTALNGQDYTHQEGSFTIPATQTVSSSATITTTDDSIPELTESFFIGIRGSNVGTIGNGVVVTVEDNEATTSVARVRMGPGHTCALSNLGDLKCWGLITSGAINQQVDIGDAPGDMGAALRPVPITTHEPIKISVGTNHACALYSNSQVKCWGSNSIGQLGQDSTTNVLTTADLLNLPYVNLGAGRSATKVCGGTAYSCALLDNGSVKCWGVQPINGTGTHKGDAAGEMATLLPVTFAGGVTATQLSCGSGHVCIVSSAEDVRCWGSASNGRLGNNSTSVTNVPNVPAISLGTGLTARYVSAGDSQTCAVLRNGSGEDKIKCWGRNDSAQLGLGDSQSRGDGIDALSMPADEMGDNLPFLDFGGGAPNALKVFVATHVTCASFAGGGFRCWGLGNYNGSVTTIGDAPGELATHPNLDFGANTVVLNLATQYRGACAIVQNTISSVVTLRCFGSNQNGQMGIGSNSNFVTTAGAATAVDLGESTPGTPFVASVLSEDGVGNNFNCVIGSNGTINEIRCWGENASGQLGHGKYALGDEAGEMGAALPTISMGMDGVDPLKIVDVDLGSGHTCALSSTGKVKCIGLGAQGQLGTASTASYGDDIRNDLAPETMANQAIISLPLPAVQIRAMGTSTCAILTDFSVYCWGIAILNGTASNSNIPILVNVGTNLKVMGLEGTPGAICSHLNDSSVKCWGTNNSGILGLNVDAVSIIGDAAGEIVAQPVINFGVDASAIPLKVKNFSMTDSTVFAHGCAVFTNNTSKCWGYNGYGPLGINNQTTVGGASISVANGPLIQTSGPFMDFSLGYYHSCAILTDFSMKCWGFNNDGERGMGNTTALGGTVGSMASVTALDLGDNGVTENEAWAWSTTLLTNSAVGANCAIIRPGDLKCWGGNNNGILGYEDEATRGTVPAEVPGLLPAVDLNF